MTENKASQERTPQERLQEEQEHKEHCLLYTSPSPRD